MKELYEFLNRTDHTDLTIIDDKLLITVNKNIVNYIKENVLRDFFERKTPIKNLPILFYLSIKSLLKNINNCDSPIKEIEIFFPISVINHLKKQMGMSTIFYIHRKNGESYVVNL